MNDNDDDNYKECDFDDCEFIGTTMMMTVMMFYISSQLKDPLNQHLWLAVHTLESEHHWVPDGKVDYDGDLGSDGDKYLYMSQDMMETTLY